MKRTSIEAIGLVLATLNLDDAYPAQRELLREVLEDAKKSQEPVAWPCHIIEADFVERTITLGMECGDFKVSAGQHWLHTTPPAAQRQWTGLTDEEIDQGLCRTPYAMKTAEAWREGVRWAYHQLKDKNT